MRLILRLNFLLIRPKFIVFDRTNNRIIRASNHPSRPIMPLNLILFLNKFSTMAPQHGSKIVSLDLLNFSTFKKRTSLLINFLDIPFFIFILLRLTIVLIRQLIGVRLRLILRRNPL